MADWTMFHNPRCSKSRETLALLESKGVKPRIVEYLKTPPDEATLREVIRKLGIPAGNLLRTKEPVFAELGINRSDDTAAIRAMVEHPVLIERPIVVRGDRAVIGRPPENVLELI